MPELPEVEVVRSGLARWVVGRRILDVRVLRDRAVRRHPAGQRDFRDRLLGATPMSVQRRGKFLWLPLVGRDEALVAHLGMSGQLVLPPAGSPAEPHLRASFELAGGLTLRFIDQRTFGWLAVEPMLTGRGGRDVPLSVAGIAPDPFEECFDPAATVTAIRRRRGPVKSALLDQGLISGVGNIYADEALWRAGRHWATPGERLSRRDALALLDHVRAVMSDALAEGGTSFDHLYVNVNGESGYFSRDLAVYGRDGQECLRCGSMIVREPYANRSAFRCPRCQRRPRSRRPTR